MVQVAAGLNVPDPVEAEVSAVLRTLLRDVPLHALRLLAARAVLARQPLDAVALVGGGRGGIELERAPDDLDLVAMRERGERELEAAPAQMAPRTGEVRPDLD